MDEPDKVKMWDFKIAVQDDDPAWAWECLHAVLDVCKKHPGGMVPFITFNSIKGEVGYYSSNTGVDGSPELTKEAMDCPVYPLRVNKTTRLEHLAMMPYRDYLQTPEWKETAKRKRQQAGKRCQLCNASGVQLDVHHRTYENRGHELDEDLIVLCHECHGIFEKAGKLKECQDANV